MPHTKRAKSLVDPRKRPIQGRSRHTVEAILEAAAQVLERAGYAETTTDLVAERAGVSIGTLYQYFPNKDALLLALAERHGNAARSVLEPLLRELVDATPPLADWLGRFVRSCVEFIGRRPRLHQTLFEETPFPPEVLEQMYRDGELIAGVLAGYLARAPGVCIENPRLAAFLLLRTIGGVGHAFVVRPPPEITLEACGEELIVLLEQYLTAARPVVAQVDSGEGLPAVQQAK